jgi:ribosomal protein S18 acetylase RimI-like enzyme/predicted nucleotidyltransferase
MGDLIYERAQLADIPLIQTAADISWRITYEHIFAPEFIANFLQRAYSSESLRRSIESDRSVFLVAKDGNQVVGFCHAGEGRNGAELFRLYVLPNHWRRGIGGRLLGIAEEWLIRRGVTDYFCYVHSQNEAGKAFYGKQGFVHRPERDREGEWRMRKVTENLLVNCRWPDLSLPYNQALREAVAYILGRFDVLGIIVSGAIIQGRPDPTSDLDIYVIHARPQRIQKRFNGAPAEIFVNPPAAIRGYFREERDRPCSAHMLANGFVILDSDPVVEELRSEARHWLQQPSDLNESELTRLRYGAADNYDNAKDIAARDLANASLILHMAVRAMLQYHFLAANRFVPREKELLHALYEFDAGLGALASDYYQTGDTDTRFNLARKIAQRTIGVEGFFEWESDLEDVQE